MKKNKVVLYFLRDSLGATVFSLLGFLFVIVFYQIVTGHRVEVLYPFLLYLFPYGIGMSYYFVRYTRLYHAVEQMMQYDDLSVSMNGKLESHVMKHMWKLHRDYAKHLEQHQLETEKEMRFVSMLVHNMKTPVTVNDLLIQRMEHKEIEPFSGIAQIKEENDCLLRNLDQTLQVLRLKEFQKDYAPEPIDLVAEVKQIINQNKKLFIYNKVFPKVEVEGESAWILADRKWNELMLEQIISNGIKYSKQEEVSKYLIFSIHKEAGRIELRIQDEGIGIPEYDLGKVFEPFFTGENGRKGYSSSGIGLYFCKEVADCLGARLQIESTEDQGTTVIVSYLAKL